MDFPAVPKSRWPLMLLLAFGAVASLVGGASLLVPPRLGYVVEPDRIVVDARAGLFDQGFTIDRARIEKVQPADLVGGSKRNGTNVPGLCAGSWDYPVIGRVRQATSCDRDTVLVTTDTGKFVLSPADRRAFVDLVLPPGAPAGYVGPADAPPETVAVAAPAPSSAGWLRYLVVLPVLALAGLAPVLLRPFKYTIADGVLTVPAHFAPVKVRLAGARIGTGRMSGIRLGGSSAPGLYLGNFRDGAGGYHAAATVREGVWVIGDTRVFVSPADVGAFTAACLAAGAVPTEG